MIDRTRFSRRALAVRGGIVTAILCICLIPWTIAGSGSAPKPNTPDDAGPGNNEVASAEIASILQDRLNSKNPFERIEAVRSLDQYPGGSRIAMRVLSDVLTSDDPEARALAAYFLGTRGPAAVGTLPQLTVVLSDAEPLVRIFASEAVLRISPETEEAFENLVQGLDDSDPKVRMMSVFAFAEIDLSHTPRIIEALTIAGDDADSQVAHAAMIVCERVRTASIQSEPAEIVRWQSKFTGSGPGWFEALASSSPDDRAGVARSLGLAGKVAADALPLLYERLDDPVAFVRGHAARAVWLIERRSDRTLPVLAELLTSGRPGTAPIAIQTVGEMGAAATGVHAELIRLAAAGDNSIQLHAATAACRIEPHDTRGWDILAAARRHDDSINRLLAVVAMTNVAPLRPDFVENELNEALKDQNLRVRMAAAKALDFLRVANSRDGSFGGSFALVGTNNPDDRTSATSASGVTIEPEVPIAVSLLEIENDESPADTDLANTDDAIELLSPAASLRVPSVADSIPELPNEGQFSSTYGERKSSTTSDPHPPTAERPQGSATNRQNGSSAGEHQSTGDGFDHLDRPIQRVRADVQTLPGELPPNHASARMPDASIVWHGVGTTRNWFGRAYGWAPTALHHNPTYLEDLNAERYGYHWGIFQGLASGARFFGTIPTLPYRIAANPPWEPVYTLGLDRPGNCVPFRCHRLPWHTGAAIVQAGAIAGVIFLVP